MVRLLRFGTTARADLTNDRLVLYLDATEDRAKWVNHDVQIIIEDWEVVAVRDFCNEYIREHNLTHKAHG